MMANIMPHKYNFFFFGCIIPENIKSMDTSLLSSYLLLLKYLEYLFINDPLIFKNLFLPIINNIIDLLRIYYFLVSLLYLFLINNIINFLFFELIILQIFCF